MGMTGWLSLLDIHLPRHSVKTRKERAHLWKLVLRAPGLVVVVVVSLLVELEVL